MIISQKLVVVLGLVYIFATRYKPENEFDPYKLEREKSKRNPYSWSDGGENEQTIF